MARKFFNQRVKGSSNKSMIAYIIVGACIILIFVAVIMVVIFSNSSPQEDSIIEIKKNALVRVNAEIVKPTEEELWKIYGHIIKKEKKKKRDTLTKVK